MEKSLKMAKNSLKWPKIAQKLAKIIFFWKGTHITFWIPISVPNFGSFGGENHSKLSKIAKKGQEWPKMAEKWPKKLTKITFSNPTPNHIWIFISLPNFSSFGLKMTEKIQCKLLLILLNSLFFLCYFTSRIKKIAILLRFFCFFFQGKSTYDNNIIYPMIYHNMF